MILVAGPKPTNTLTLSASISSLIPSNSLETLVNPLSILLDCFCIALRSSCFSVALTIDLAISINASALIEASLPISLSNF